jgi:DNA-binding MarR family transcriptional regulator
MPPFGRSVGFLLSQTGDATAHRFKDALVDLAIEPRHFGVMRAIQAAENRSQQALAETLNIPASSMVALLDQLETRRLVARHLDPNDRRVRVVEITDEGRELLRRATEVAMEIEQLVCGDLSGDERRELIALLQRVARNLDLRFGVHPSVGDPHAHDPH